VVARQRRDSGDASEIVRKSLGGLAKKLQGSEELREGTVVLRLGGPAGGDYHFESDGQEVRLVDAAEAALDREPLLEILGEAETIRSIIDGEKDAAKQFFAGGIRVRGDLRYLSDVAIKLGLLDQPL
jgi:hypothetical protein